MRKYKKAEDLQKLGLFLAAILMGYAFYCDQTEPPTPARIMPTVTVTTEAAAGLEEELIVNTLEYEDIETEKYYDSLELLACCVEAEAGNQSILGKRLVVDVILNRVDSTSYPDTIEGVIFQPNQFAVVNNGQINKVTPTTETYEAVALEYLNRISNEVLFFQTGGYSSYGPPFERVGEHYFSKGGRI